MDVSEVGKRNRGEEGINCGYSLMCSCFVYTCDVDGKEFVVLTGMVRHDLSASQVETSCVYALLCARMQAWERVLMGKLATNQYIMSH